MENFKLELRGLGGEVDNVVINAEGCRIWFLGKCSDVQLYGLRLHNGNTSPGGGNGNGGLIYVSALTGRLFASHVRFTSSYAKQNGGALMLYGGGVIALSECSFSGNNADTGLGNDVCVSGKPDRSSRLIRCGMGSTSAHVQLHNDDRSNADNLVNIDDPCTLDYINDNYLGNGVCVTTTSTVTITTTTTSATETTTSATTTTVTTTSATTTTITVTTTTKTTTTITETTTTTVTTTTIRVCTEGKFYNADGNTCTTCPSGTFNNRPEHSIDACEPWTECTGDQFESKIPSAASDRVCGTTGECNFDLQFESKAPSEKTDRECTTFIPRLLTGFAMHATIQKGNGRMVLTKQTAKLCRRAASMRKFLMWAVLLKILHARRVRVATNNLPETTNCRIATEQQQRRRKRAPQRREQVRQRQKRLHPSPQQP